MRRSGATYDTDLSFENTTGNDGAIVLACCDSERNVPSVLIEQPEQNGVRVSKEFYVYGGKVREVIKGIER